LWINGINQPIVSSESPAGNIKDVAGVLNIGWDGQTDKLNGTLDEVVIYNRALSPSEIQAIYNAGSAGKCAPEPAVCGNGVAEGSEECDDGNTVSGDGCSDSCKIEFTGSDITASNVVCTHYVSAPGSALEIVYNFDFVQNCNTGTFTGEVRGDTLKIIALGSTDPINADPGDPISGTVSGTTVTLDPIPSLGYGFIPAAATNLAGSSTYGPLEISGNTMTGTVSFDFPVWTNFPNEPETLAPSGIQAGGTVTCVFPAPITNCA